MDLNIRQKRILELLSINCRFTNKDIGRTIRLSEDGVGYQINKVINEEKMAKFSVQFDYRFLGYAHFHIFIRLNDLDFDVEKLKKINAITSINFSYGKFDLQIIVISKNKNELSETINKIEKILDVGDISVAEFDSFYKRFTNIISPLDLKTQIPVNRKNKVYDLDDKSYANAKEIKKINLDDVDKKIISVLLENPRIKFSEVSKKTGLNHETVRYRINNYIKIKFIKNFGLLHDFKKYGLYVNYLLLKLKNLDETKFKNYLVSNKNIFYSAKLVGEYNCIIYVTSKNPNEFGKQLKEIRDILKSSIIKMDLLYLEEVIKYVQFPEEILK